ncbi:MAG: NaMN--DMB phosphoribosyltransferase [Prochlorococcaceae cyanobacterium]
MAADWGTTVDRARLSGGLQVMLVLGGTETAAVPGISAAGATAQSRRLTAAADAELLLLGPAGRRPHALPPLPAGVSPALISWVACQGLALEPLVIDAGAMVAPAVPHLRLGLSPARCLSTGRAMAATAVQRRRQFGRSLATRWRRRHPDGVLLLAECVPGGTSTAEALLCGLGVAAAGLVSGSCRQPPHGLRAALVDRGLAAARGAGVSDGDSLGWLAAVGDPLQALALGLLEGLLDGPPQPPASGGAPAPRVLLAGGSQMAAILALALSLAPPAHRPWLAAHAAVVTTAWVAQEPSSDLEGLLGRIGERWQVAPQLLHSGLRFHRCRSGALRDYEQGYVKEGVGAGGLAWLWEQLGGTAAELAERCDRACELLEASR